MLDRIGEDWNAYLSAVVGGGAEAIERHTRQVGRLGNERFIEALEAKTGNALVPKRPGRKPAKVE